MPYLPASEVKIIRNTLKEQFPGWKFSVKGRNHTSVDVTVLAGPLEFPVMVQVSNGGGNLNPGYIQINKYYFKDRFMEYPDWLDALTKMDAIVGGKQETEVMDSDYGRVPTYYYSINVGNWDKPYIYKHKFGSK